MDTVLCIGGPFFVYMIFAMIASICFPLPPPKWWLMPAIVCPLWPPYYWWWFVQGAPGGLFAPDDRPRQ